MTDTPAVKLEAKLERIGVTVIRNTRIVGVEDDGTAVAANGRRFPAGCSVWTIGVQPNPAVRGFGLPVDAIGRLLTDPWYRVPGYDAMYAIGDNARIVDDATGIEDGMTCREAILQGNRLAKVILADVTGRPAEPHRAPSRQQYCISLGGGEGFAWMQPFFSRLAPDVVLVSDGGGKAVAATVPVVSRERVSAFLMGLLRKFGDPERVRFVPAVVNSGPGLIVLEANVASTVFSFALGADGSIRNIYIVRNPDKLGHVERNPMFAISPQTSQNSQIT